MAMELFAKKIYGSNFPDAGKDRLEIHSENPGFRIYISLLPGLGNACTQLLDHQV